MVRRPEYERDEVLEKAMGVFWTRGYKATSISDLVEATGLNTASMYKEFGDKDGIFEEALDHYRKSRMSARFRMLADEPNLKGIERFVRNVVDGAAQHEYRGCLMMNHLSQQHPISAKAAERIEDFCASMESHLEAAFRNAREQGEIAADQDPATLASFVACYVHGLVLYGRHMSKKAHIPDLCKVLLGVWAPRSP